MRRLWSVRTRITLWYAALILAICAAALLSLAALAGYAQTAHAQRTLESAAAVIQGELADGELEIDADIDDVPNVYAALFEVDGTLIYGRKRVTLPLSAGGVRRAQGEGHGWYVLDTRIALKEGETVWLRTMMTAGLPLDAAHAALGYGLWLLPALAAVALGGGAFLTARALRPVGEMTRVAQRIAQGGSLSDRAALSRYAQGRDELHALAAALLGMLERLDAAFARERQFTSDAAHELRTPLSAMRAQGEYALSRTQAQEKDEAIARMLEKNEEMRALVDQLLLIARLDAGQMPMEDDVALAPLLSSVAQDMEPVALERGVSVETALTDVHVRGNRAMLTRAAVNLLDNAIRYGREGGHVRITLARDAQGASICVQDDGVGMTTEALSHAFERFWRGDSARGTSGTGIGLSIVAAAARAHGGSVQASSAPGEGSRFTIRLPEEILRES